MAKGNINSPVKQGKRRRPGVHSKTKTSNHKRSKNYQKSYKGQG